LISGFSPDYTSKNTGDTPSPVKRPDRIPITMPTVIERQILVRMRIISVASFFPVFLFSLFAIDEKTDQSEKQQDGDAAKKEHHSKPPERQTDLSTQVNVL